MSGAPNTDSVLCFFAVESIVFPALSYAFTVIVYSVFDVKVFGDHVSFILVLDVPTFSVCVYVCPVAVTVITHLSIPDTAFVFFTVSLSCACTFMLNPVVVGFVIVTAGSIGEVESLLKLFVP